MEFDIEAVGTGLGFNAGWKTKNFKSASFSTLPLQGEPLTTLNIEEQAEVLDAFIIVNFIFP